MFNLAIYLAQSENRPAGLIGHNRQEVAQTYAATLASSGLMGRSASSSRDFSGQPLPIRTLKSCWSPTRLATRITQT